MNATTPRFRTTMLMVAVALGASLEVSAAVTDISQSPLASSSANLVKPNISYVLDSSGSMEWSHAPDESQPFHDGIGYKSFQCNSIYYNPNIIYPPPRVYDGTTFPVSSFTAAPVDGFSSYNSGSTATVALGSAFYAYDSTTGNTGSGDTPQAAYYYLYYGSQAASGANYQNQSSPFYVECNSPEAANGAGVPTSTITFGGVPTPNDQTLVNSITVNGTTITAGPTTATSSTSSLATLVAAQITQAGYSAAASGSTVTIAGPTSLAVPNPPTPVVTATPGFTNGVKIAFTGTKNTSVTSITVNGVEITTGISTPSTSQNTVAANVAAVINGGVCTASVSSNQVTLTNCPISMAGFTPVVTVAGNQVSTVSFGGTASNTAVTGITVGGTQIMAGTATAATANTLATAVDAQISANGFTATSATNVVTITGPPAATINPTPVVTAVTAAPTTTITFSGSTATIVSGIKVNGVQIMGAASTAASTSAGVASAVASAINANGFSASYPGSGSTLTVTGPPGTTGSPVLTIAAGGVTGTITVGGTAGSSTVTSIKVGSTTITSGTASGSTAAALAASIQSKITAGGYSATYPGSGAVVTILGPTSGSGVTPTVAKTGSMSVTPNALALVTPMTATTAAFSGPAPMTATASGFTAQSADTVAITGAPFPLPGVMTATITPFAPFIRKIVSATSGPGGTDERQNFANWFTYYRTRILMMKSGLGRAFVSIGASYRVGFMTIQADPSSSSFPSFLAINDFATGTATPTTCTSPQKCRWFRAVYSQLPNNSTPLKQALSYAAQNLAGRRGPDPGQYSCQQNFILMSTDGYWNNGTTNGTRLDKTTAIGNVDNTVATAPRPQYDGGLSGSTNTLADVAWYYYNADMRNGTANATLNAPAVTCNTGVSGADMCADNVPISGIDNAPWQHVTTFTLGLGVNGQLNYDTAYLTGGSADYNAIVSGSKNWPTPVGDQLTTIDDLWHTAVNGHGQYFSAKNPDLLVSGLNTALAGVSARLAAGAAAATSNLEPVAGDNFAFVASYTTQEWTGDLQSRTINLTTGAISTTANWSAQATLDAMATDVTDSRTIYFNSGTASSPVLTSFVPASFTTAQKSSWFTPANAPQLTQYASWAALQQTAGTADTVINYLRGQYGNEERGTNIAANQLYRVRSHVLGDIIDGKPVYMRLPPFKYAENGYGTFAASATVTSRTGTVFVGGNDGMLHAFDATNGNELWAFIPSAVLPNLKSLADDNYATNHKYFVDGSPVITDIWNGTAWKSIIVMGLGAGGKSYFAIDITTPASPALLWEFTDTNLGYSFGNPVVGKLTTGTWVVSFTSGYNNVGDGVGRLYVINAWTGATISTLSTGQGSATSPSGLNKIAAWVDNGLADNTIQRIYGGDQFGSLWRFDINNQYPPAGADAFQLATFQVGTYQQPVTTQPELGLVNGAPVIYVGTGRYLGASDLSDTNQQSLYAIVDKLTGTGIGNARTETTCPLVQQSLTVIDVNTRSTSTLPVDLATKCGWYVDFNPTGGNTPGERVNIDPKLQLGVLAVATNIPEVSVCSVGGSSFLYFFDYSTGQFVSTSTNNVVGSRIGNAIAVGENTYQLPSGQVVTTVTTSDDQHPTFGNPSATGTFDLGKRVMWRELLN